VVTHEVCHDDAGKFPVMKEFLDAGVRHLPGTGDALARTGMKWLPAFSVNRSFFPTYSRLV